MNHAVLDQLRATLRRGSPEDFASELAGRLAQLRIACMVDGRVLPAEEASALHAALVALAAEALPSLTARDPRVALDVVESAGLSAHRAGVERALVEQRPHLGPMLEVFGAHAADRSYSLATWLKEFSAATGRLRGVSRDDLLEEVDELEPWATRDDGSRKWRFQRADSAEVWKLLLSVSSHEPSASHGGVPWVHSFDYKDSEAWGVLPAMIGVPEDARFLAEFRALGDRARELGLTVEAPDFVEFCNRRAHELGKELRLFAVDAHGDEYLFVALTPAACKAAVERGLIEVEPYLSSLPLTATKWAGATGTILPWLAGALGLLALLVFVVYTGGGPGAMLAVVGVIVAFELLKSRAIQSLDRAIGARYPGLMRVIKALTKT